MNLFKKLFNFGVNKEFDYSNMSTELVIFNLFKAKYHVDNWESKTDMTQPKKHIEACIKELNSRGYGEEGIKLLAKARFSYKRFKHCYPERLFDYT